METPRRRDRIRITSTSHPRHWDTAVVLDASDTEAIKVLFEHEDPAKRVEGAVSLSEIEIVEKSPTRDMVFHSDPRTGP